MQHDLSPSASSLVGRAHPIARISRGALVRNLSGHPREVFADARHDGWGVGASLITEIARERGLAGTMTDAGPEAFAGEVPENFAVITPALASGTLDGMSPVISLVGTVLGTKNLLAGEGVSYGYIYRASADTRVALVTGGYAQGIVRDLGNKLAVAIDGHRCRIVGRVAMDVCVVEIGEVDVADGADVVYLGDPSRGEPGIDEWTTLTGLSAEEILLPIGQRARREVVA